jgi:hypothetical protein
MTDHGKNLGKYLHKAKPQRGERASEAMKHMNSKVPKNGTSKPAKPEPDEGGVRG